MRSPAKYLTLDGVMQAPGDPLAGTMNDMPKYVASTSLTEPLAWQDSTLLRGDAAADVADLRKKPGKDLLVIGSGNLVQTLVQHDLVDEYRLMTIPS